MTIPTIAKPVYGLQIRLTVAVIVEERLSLGTGSRIARVNGLKEDRDLFMRFIGALIRHGYVEVPRYS